MPFTKEEVKTLLTKEWGFTESDADKELKSFQADKPIEIKGTFNRSLKEQDKIISLTVNLTDPSTDYNKSLWVVNNQSKIFRYPKKGDTPQVWAQFVRDYKVEHHYLLLKLKNADGFTDLHHYAGWEPQYLAGSLEALKEEDRITTCLTTGQKRYESEYAYRYLGGFNVPMLLAEEQPTFLNAHLKIYKEEEHRKQVFTAQLHDGRNLIQILASSKTATFGQVKELLQEISKKDYFEEVCTSKNSEAETLVHVLKHTYPDCLRVVFENLKPAKSVGLVLAGDVNGNIPINGAPVLKGQKEKLPSTYLLFQMTQDMRNILCLRRNNPPINSNQEVAEYLEGYMALLSFNNGVLKAAELDSKSKSEYVAGLLQAIVDEQNQKEVRKEEKSLFLQLLSKLNDYYQSMEDKDERHSDGVTELLKVLTGIYQQKKTENIEHILMNMVAIFLKREKRIEGKDRSYENDPKKPTNKFFMESYDTVKNFVDAGNEEKYAAILSPYKQQREINSLRTGSSKSEPVGKIMKTQVDTNPLILLHQHIVMNYVPSCETEDFSRKMLVWFKKFYAKKLEVGSAEVNTGLLGGELSLPRESKVSVSFMSKVREEIRVKTDAAACATKEQVSEFTVFLSTRIKETDTLTDGEKNLIQNLTDKPRTGNSKGSTLTGVYGNGF